MELFTALVFSYLFLLLILATTVLIPKVRGILSWRTVLPATLIPALFTVILYFIYGVSVTADTEYFGGYALNAEYYEDWDEEVPCTHPVYCTRIVQKSYDCGSAGKSRTCYRSESERYECGKEHPYDVDYHPPYWQINDSNGNRFSIGQDTFSKLSKRWNNNKFVDLSRDYHKKDGDKYVTVFDNLNEHIEATAIAHSYKNNIPASNSLLRFRDISPEEALRLGVYGYPDINNYFQHSIIAPKSLGIDIPENEYYVQLINARLGRKKQVRVFFLLYLDKSSEIFESQQRYWQGGNKNEIIIGVGVNRGLEVKWANAFSWAFTSTEYGNRLHGEEIKNFIASQEKLNIPEISKWLYGRIDSDYVRRPFTPINENTEIAYPFWLCVISIIFSNSFSTALIIFPVAPEIVNWYNAQRSWTNLNFSKWRK